MQAAAGSCFFCSVEPLPDCKLLVETLPGEGIFFDFASRLHTTRYGDLCVMSPSLTVSALTE